MKITLKSFWILPLLFVGPVALARPAPPPEIQQRLLRTKNLSYHMVKETPGSGVCSGVIVARNAFLTAAHCEKVFADHVDSWEGKKKRKFRYYSSRQPLERGAQPDKSGRVKQIIDLMNGAAYANMRKCETSWQGSADKSALKLGLCYLSQFHRHDILLMVTEKPVFAEDQVLPVSSQVNENEPLVAIVYSWLRRYLPENGPGFFVPNPSDAREGKVARDFTFHTVRPYGAAASFVRCLADDPFDMCTGYPGDSGGPVVRETENGFEVVGVLSGLFFDPEKITDPETAIKIQDLLNNRTVNRGYKGAYPLALAPALVSPEMQKTVESLR